MNRTKPTLGALGLLITFVAVSPVQADIARPIPREKPRVVMHTSMVVTSDTKAYDARLQITKESLKELRAALGDLPANETGTQSSGAITQRLTGSSTRTLMAGLMMFVSLSLGGIWLARSVQSRGQKTVAAFLVGTAVIGAAAIITQANAGPPPSWQWRKLSTNLTQGRPTYASVNIEIVDEPGHGIKLIVPVTPNARTKDD